MNLGVRGHDVPSESVELLCQKLCQLGLYEIQLVAHKSFPDFPSDITCISHFFQTLQVKSDALICSSDHTPGSG